jgi:hypothetical protein
MCLNYHSSTRKSVNFYRTACHHIRENVLCVLFILQFTYYIYPATFSSILELHFPQILSIPRNSVSITINITDYALGLLRLQNWKHGLPTSRLDMPSIHVF